MKFVKLFSLEDKDAGAGAGGGAGAGTGSGASGAGSGGGAGDGAGSGAAAAGAGAGAGSGAGAGAGAGGAGTGAGAGAGGGAGAGAGAGAAAGAAAGEGGAGGAGAGGAATPQWDADHWKSTYAGKDEAKAKWVERYADLPSALDAARNANKRIEELTLLAKAVLPKDATPEQIAAYRKDNGIPDAPEKYLDALPADVKASIDDQDKAIITPYLSLIQKHNLSPSAAAEFIQLRQAEADRWAEERISADAKVKQATEDALRADWGNNYRAEINSINNLLNGAPEDVRDMLFDARLPDGRGVLAVPETLRWLAQHARMINPYSVPVGSDGGSLDQKGVDARINEIEGLMGAKQGTPEHAKYWKNDKVQAEYRELITAREAMKKRSQAA